MEQPRFCGQELLPPALLPWEATIFSSAIQQMVEANEHSTTTPLLAPASPAATDGSVEQYIGWIHRHIPDCEPAAYVVAFVYIRRFLEKQQSRGRPFPVTSSNFHHLVLLSIMLANKNLTQRVYSNAHYAMVGGMSTAEINELERLFLSALKFDLHVDTEHYESCYAFLEFTHREMLRRRVDAAEQRRQQQLLLALLERSRLLGS